VSVAIARCGAIFVSALAFGLAGSIEQPWALLVWVALVPWLASLERERTAVATILSATAMSAAFVVVIFAWFAAAVARYADVSPLITFALLIVAGPALQPQFIVFAVVRHVVAGRGLGRIVTGLAAAFAWVGTDWICPHLFGDALGTGLFAFTTLRQGADVAGVAGLTFIILLVNEAIYAAIIESRRSVRGALPALAVVVVLLSLLTGYGVVRLRQIDDATTEHAPLAAALVQANLDDYEGLRERLGTYETVRRILDAHESLSQDAITAESSTQPLELLIWPETVYPTTFGKPKSADGAAFDEEIVRFAKTTGMPLIFGSYDRKDDIEFNAAVLLQHERDGETLVDFYRKKHLFPLTERVPAWLDTESVRDRFPWLGTWNSGNGPGVFALGRRGGGELKIAPLICLDAVDPNLALTAARAGADSIITLSNDGWFADSPGANLHLVVSAFRSIETRLPQLRATTTGISAIISPTGEISARSPVGQATVLTGVVTPGNRAPTMMMRWGDWFGRAAAVAAFGLLLYSLLFARRSPG
jgi:apolipoprotein N-acyltransferase